MESTTYYLRLKALSPIHIGCDEVYEPTGFTVDGKKQELIAFQPADFLRRLGQDKIAEYSVICKKGTVPSLLEIYKFVRRNKEYVQGLKISVSSSFVQHYNKTLKLSGGNIQNNLNRFQIGRTAFQRLNGVPYIPGSALKGALRTAILNYRSRGTPHQRVRKSAELEERLVGGTFSTDPFRLLKVGDFQAINTVSQRIVYGINRKKRPAKKEAGGPYQILEVVEAGAEFAGTVTVMVPEAGTGIAREKQITFEEIQKALQGFYTVEQEKEKLCLQGIQCQADVRQNVQPGSNLLRVGRHSGAECVTVTGYRDIKIMQGPGERPKYKEYSTTVWLAAESDNPDSNISLQPFGWMELSEMSAPEISALKKHKKESFTLWEKEQQHSIMALRVKKEELVRLRQIEELEFKKAEEEQKAREEELRKYPWRELLARLHTIRDWGALKMQALELEELLLYQSEKEVGETIRKVAESVADGNPKKWNAERDRIVAEWLGISGVKWQSKNRVKRTTADNSFLEQIQKFSGPGDYDRKLKIADIDIDCCHALVPLFKKWKWDKKKKAKAGNHKLWQELRHRLKVPTPRKEV